jgi:hypothetical protein
MASPKFSGHSALLPFLIILVVMAEPGIALTLEPEDTILHFPPLLDCSPASAATPSSSAFRANVLSLLDSLPSAAATAPSRAASASATATASRACPAPPPTSPPCATAAGAWRDGCFASFADTNATSPREEALRLWFYDDDDGGDSPTPASALERLCAADREETECARCLNESARAVPELKRRRRLSRVHGDAVVVVGYTCFLRVLLDDPLPRWRVIGEHSLSSVIPLFLCHPLKLELGRACCWQSGR